MQHQIQDLPYETLGHLLGSRYCETQILSEDAWRLFGHTPLGWARVQAVCDFVTGTPIPARYCTGYLGDIGVPPVPDPMDFSGWFEAFLGGQWRTFDARHNKPRIGRIPIAYGQDAGDVAISTAFGPEALLSFRVTTFEVKCQW